MIDIHCRDERRRAAVRRAPLNGLDYLEVSPDHRRLTVYFLGKAPEPIAKENLRITGGERVRGIEVVDIDVHRHEDLERDDCMDVMLDRPGDFSTYRLCVVALDASGKPTTDPLPGFDRRYACLDFSFMAGCPSDVDCALEPACPPEPRVAPEISYLAKDYGSFRQLILDRLALVMPEWHERHAPDLGITLIELLAYVGDHLSYYQDAVATEAYIDTARERISVRRHARLVDYFLHEGNNARAWVALEVGQEQLSLSPAEFYFTTTAAGTGGSLIREEDLPADEAFLVFEPMVEPDTQEILLRSARNEICLYTWGNAQCCLPKGATSAVLRDLCGPGTTEAGESEQPPSPTHTPQQSGKPGTQPSKPAGPQHTLKLAPCDVLIFEEVKGAKTGNPADADPAHRHAVRLTKATPDVDPLTNTPIWQIEWAPEDALPFPVCVSSIGPAPECEPISDVTVVRGNVLLVDHGRRRDDDLGQVPTTTILPDCCDGCFAREVRKLAGRYAPTLRYPEVTFREPPAACSAPAPCDRQHMTAATALLRQDPRKATPQVVLYGIPATPEGIPAYAPSDLVDATRIAASLAHDEAPTSAWLRNQLTQETRDRLDGWKTGGASQPLPSALQESLTLELRALQQTWVARLDLLGSGPDDRHFVVEVDDERRAHIRFGDGDAGRRPDAGATFRAAYRVGNGPLGNVGAETICRTVFRSGFPSGAEIRARNPMPAFGGTAPEPIREAKLLAPGAFRRTLLRAVTPADYAAIAMRDFGASVQQAVAALRWTGSTPVVLVAIDPFASAVGDASLLCEIGEHLERFRRIGHDVQVAWARSVALDVGLTVCVLPTYLRGHVKAGLIEALSNRTLPDGRRGFFHPDNLTFGEGVYLSRLVAAAQAVPGVESVRVDKLERLYEGPNGELENGLLPLGPLEVARLDNDPSFPEHGQLTLTLRGGR